MKRMIFGIVFVLLSIVENEAEKTKPLFLTKYLENGEIEKGKEEALVKHHEIKNVTSYAGYFTIDKLYNSNLFFWFFLSKSNPKTDPVLIWIDGGPGSSSLGAVFNYIGPHFVHENQTLGLRKYTPLRDHSIIFLDGPVGTGYSFTDNLLGYAKNEKDIDRQVLNFLIQFFTLFEEYRSNDLYFVGDSYAAKYCVTVARAIKHYNDKASEKFRINMKGSAFGNGFINPVMQSRSAEFMYHLGLIDFNGRDKIFSLTKQIDKLRELKEKTHDPKIIKAFFQLKERKKALIKDLTGFDYYQNILITKRPKEKKFFEKYVVTPEMRKAIHVGNITFYKSNEYVRMFLIDDIEKDETSALEEILEYYKVLIYNGHLDLSAIYPSSEEYYTSLNWSGAKEYRNAERKFWIPKFESSNGIKFTLALAGYWKTAKNMHEIMVREAGHIVSFDHQMTGWYCDLITRFTRDDFPT